MAFSRSTETKTYQPLDSDLTAIAAISNADGNIIVGDGSSWVAESGATARASLGLSNVAVTDTKQDWTAAQKPATQTATITATSVTLDFDAYQNFVLTMNPSTGTTMTLDNPSTDSGNVGQTGVIILIQPTSAITVLLGSQYKPVGGTAPTLSSGSSKVDILPYCIQADDAILIGAPQLDLKATS